MTFRVCFSDGTELLVEAESADLAMKSAGVVIHDDQRPVPIGAALDSLQPRFTLPSGKAEPCERA